ncbi:MAG: PRC-barrel domain-containing protein [bacterium]|nr:PRC-barrel domain-containing protein [bacterium]
MLIEATSLVDYPVLSLHVGGEIARVVALVVEPEKLKVVAFQVLVSFISGEDEPGEFLESRDVREFSQMGMIVDSEEVFVNTGEVVSLDKVLSYQFSPFGLKVVTKAGANLGKVVDFVVETDGFLIRQLIVRRPIMKAILDPELVIPRSEIVEVTDDKIIVKDEEEKIRKKAIREEFRPNFVNPFREPDFSARKVVNERKEK